MTGYAEIAVTSNFSFLRGASRPEELSKQACAHGYAAIGIADRNTLAGVVRAYAGFDDPELPKEKPKFLVGARLVFEDGTPDILAYPVDRKAYGNLCRLLTVGKLRAKKGDCTLYMSDLLEWQTGLLLAVMPPMRGALTKIRDALETVREAAPDRLWLAASMLHRGDDRRRLKRLKTLAQEMCVPLLAVNDVLYHEPARRELQDVVTCIREHLTIDKAGRLLEANAERHLKSPEEMTRLFRDAPDAIAETIHFADRISFSLSQLKYNYPEEPVPKGRTPDEYLRELTWAGAHKRYPDGIPDSVRVTLEKELALIAEARIRALFPHRARHCRFRARAQHPVPRPRFGSQFRGLLCARHHRRRSRRRSICCSNASFRRNARSRPTSTSISSMSGAKKSSRTSTRAMAMTSAALTATVICYRPRSAIREVGKVFGLTEDVTAAMASGVWGSWGSALKEKQVRQGMLDPQNAAIAQAVSLANEIMGFPAASFAACRRLCADARPARRHCARRSRHDGGSLLHRMGQGRYRPA